MVAAVATSPARRPTTPRSATSAPSVAVALPASSTSSRMCRPTTPFAPSPTSAPTTCASARSRVSTTLSATARASTRMAPSSMPSARASRPRLSVLRAGCSVAPRRVASSKRALYTSSTHPTPEQTRHACRCLPLTDHSPSSGSTSPSHTASPSLPCHLQNAAPSLRRQREDLCHARAWTLGMAASIARHPQRLHPRPTYNTFVHHTPPCTIQPPCFPVLFFRSLFLFLQLATRSLSPLSILLLAPPPLYLLQLHLRPPQPSREPSTLRRMPRPETVGEPRDRFLRRQGQLM
ncbi:hypothetical protein VHUM_01912 [Vanrija humicola]|uniref:Uncharacterized protein n=1 Tax=Vanrija humicola TaxID=5417 RepID=A0A7D8Z4H9_VANHU|nr:hypothetical protein VHUM_01912 [Vanrija humicola]